jgi:acetoin:2,6-dichlorophenolindophenol oxidoreductase subunit beta
MSLNKRKLSYALAINEAITQMMALNKEVFVIGQGLKSPWYVGKTAYRLIERFGERRVIDTPVSENAITGAAVGAAIAGMRAIVVHPRIDFMVYALDPIINEAANWSYMFGGKSFVPVVFWGIINRGGEQGAQHSQSLHALFSHIPGLKVVMPSNPYDAKGLMTSAIKDNNPVVFIDDRWLYGIEADVPKSIYSIPIGKGAVRTRGKDITIVASSYMVIESIKSALELKKEGISAEIIDIRTMKPLDEDLICSSAKKTGKVVIADGGWRSFGASAEIAALISEKAYNALKAPVARVTLPDIPAPSSSTLEKAYYPGALDISRAVRKTIKRR